MIDIMVITDQDNLSPHRVYRDLAPNFQEQVRSIVVLDRNTGLTSTFHDDDAVLGR